MEPSCSELNVILYIDKELPEPEMLRMESHFARCQECRELLDEHRLLRLGLNLAVSMPVPENFADSVMARIPSPFQSLLTSARDRIITAAAALGLTGLGLAASSLGQQASSPAEMFSLQAINQTILQFFSWCSDGFRLAIQVAQALAMVLGFMAEGFSFALRTMGELVLHSPGGQAMAALSLALFALASTGLALLGRHSTPRHQEARK